MGGRFGELLLILLIVLVLFGAGRIPQIMGDVGRGLRALKDALSEDPKDNKDDKHKH